MAFEFTDRAQSAVGAASQLAKDYAHPQVTGSHLALALLLDSSGPTVTGVTAPGAAGAAGAGSGSAATESLFHSVLSKAGVDVAKLEQSLRDTLRKIPQQNPPPDETSFSREALKVIQEADKLKKTQHDSYIAQDHLLLALVDHDTTLKGLLKAAGLANSELLKTAITNARGARRIESKASEAGFDALNKYCTDLTMLAAEGKLDPVIGRDDEIRRVVRVLSRRTKNNAVLIGEPGTGKTAVMEGLAQRIIDRDVPPNLLGRLLSLDMGALMAGAKYRGEYEERVKAVLDEIEKATENGTNIILAIDEMHLLMAGKGGDSGMDAANLIKPMLARGKLRCIGATTLAEYRQYIEKDAAFERRFQQVLVEEPDVNATIAILRGLRDKYEVHHSVRILDSALVQAAVLAKRYLTSRRAPDSAIDLVDEACADVRVQRDTVPEDIDKLQRKKLQLEVAIHALEREKDASSKEDLEKGRKELSQVDEELAPLIAKHDAEKAKGDEINNVRRRIEELQQKALDAERRYDLQTAADLRYYAIPELEVRLKSLQMEERKREEEGVSNGANTVTSERIAQIVARWTGIPAAKMMEGEKQKLLKLEHLLAKDVIGQPEAVKAVAQAIRLSRSGLANPNRPIASLLFCGPSGTGKTLLSKALSKQLFDDENAMMRIDASEYSEKHSISRLIGAPPGYVGHDSGGQLTEWIRRRPYSVVLIDEIEKAAKEFVTLFLQILDDGRCTDGQGRVVSFKNCVIIMTSNLGSASINADPSADEGGSISPATQQLVQSAIAQHFVPEFINRIDSTIIFRKLSRKDIRSIVESRVKEVQHRLWSNGRRIKLQLDDGAKDYLASIGYNPSLGARPLNRAIQSSLLNPLSLLILRGQVRDNETVTVTFDGPGNCLLVNPNHPIPPEFEDINEDIDMDSDMASDAFIEEEPLD
ncbi:P-loop containing nucleoside triphosphate hydrolase protein [Tilletiaria anomala UBC 951]|uniref:p-loop containing nucleoside triphosphate hydrolase protein n=1 Tax=Tilletiaria anomala (strain ATCC 24038 / CBS 436.72 / UBC 951) TaxID=1037660 RepID=A0A066WKL2_TILAU|nr:P-loop containing nucleoside triphosphate hydrolase protein [Tilletiaria anomala UBC 951]KDN53123.1 P-loop containing nucleoside triphosphate hydrolase protein [Tilletiaria anomala UBC 951]